MLIKAIKFFIGCLLFSMLILGCAKKPEEIASMIHISYPASQNIPSGLGMDIELTNKSKYCIVFPVVTGMTIYTMRDGKETKVDNLITIIGNEDTILNPKGEAFSKRDISIVPDTSTLLITEPTQFYVRLTGYLCDDESVKIIKEIPFNVVP